MRKPPNNRIAPEALKAWKITGVITASMMWLSVISGMIALYYLELPLWFGYVGIIITIICTYLFIFLLPKLRWRRWRYELFEQEIYIQHGILIKSLTLVPMVKVQHVNTNQGPILKKYKLATVLITTAATTHEIPALPEEEASELRDRISKLVKVVKDDV